MATHQCKLTDHILLVAKQEGFNDWKAVWDANSELQSAQGRKNPNILFKGPTLAEGGDELTLPEKATKEKPKGTEATHKFTAATKALYIAVRVLAEDFTALKDQDYVLTIPGASPAFERKGKLDGKGQLQEKIPPDTTKAMLTVTLPAPAQGTDKDLKGKGGMSWELLIGALNPILEKAPDEACVSGVQQRLNNLGFLCGAISGVLDDTTKNQLKAFQTKYKIDPAEGASDTAKTQPKLKDIHDKPDSIVEPPK
jgi:hypothetical protein